VTYTAGDWMTVAKAARVAAVSERTIWSLCARGKLASRKQGSRRVVSADAIAIYARKKTLKLQFHLQSDSTYKKLMELEQRVRRLELRVNG
jgi:hypothetical protein